MKDSTKNLLSSQNLQVEEFAEKHGDVPPVGRLKRKRMIDATKETLPQLLKDNKVVVLDFWASWCGPCKKFEPIFSAAADAHTDLCFAKVDCDDQQELSDDYGVRSIPTLIVFKNGEIFTQKVGSVSTEQLERLISEANS